MLQQTGGAAGGAARHPAPPARHGGGNPRRTSSLAARSSGTAAVTAAVGIAGEDDEEGEQQRPLQAAAAAVGSSGGGGGTGSGSHNNPVAPHSPSDFVEWGPPPSLAQRELIFDSLNKIVNQTTRAATQGGGAAGGAYSSKSSHAAAKGDSRGTYAFTVSCTHKEAARNELELSSGTQLAAASLDSHRCWLLLVLRGNVVGRWVSRSARSQVHQGPEKIQRCSTRSGDSWRGSHQGCVVRRAAHRPGD